MSADQTAVKENPQASGSSARGSSFYTAMRFMPAPQREAMYEIYHFCRTIDDIADEGGETPERLRCLREWRDNMALLYDGHTPPPALYGLANAIAGFGLRREDFLAVIDGMEMDVNGPIRAPDEATLALYCDRVACAVGRLSVRVFGLEEEDGQALAHHLGNALQLTNILRDIDEDAEIGRLYLPRELLAEAGITETDPARALGHPAIADVCDKIARRARNHFEEADAVMRRCERKRVRTPRIMAQAYRAIHDALVARGFAPPRRPVHVSKARLGYILVRNVLF